MTEHLIENSAGYRFDPANNSADHYRLSRVLLEGAEDKRLEDPEWLRFVGRCIEFGSQNVNGTTVSQAKKAHQARNRFEYEAGLGRPDHPLHRALEIRKKQQQPLPFVLIDTVAALDEITGDGVNTINSCKILLGS